MSTAKELIETIKQKNVKGGKHFSTNNSSGGFRVDVSQMFKDPRVQRELRQFSNSRLVKDIRNR